MASYKVTPDEINSGAEFLVIGEAPGKQEDGIGPFKGASGQALFDRFLIHAGVQRRQCHITNVLPVRPPDNKFDRIGELGLSVEQFLPDLQKKVIGHKWKAIIVVGNEAMEAVTGLRSIESRRGSPLTDQWGQGNLVFPMIHPARLMRLDKARQRKEEQKKINQFTAAMLLDMQKLRFMLRKGLKSGPERTLLTWNNCRELGSYLAHLRRLEDANSLAFDIETYKGTITAISFADSATWGMSVPFCRQFGLEGEVQLIQAIARVLAAPSWKIAHNGAYDITYIATAPGWKLPIRNFWLDTMLLHHVLHIELPHSLEFVCSQYTLQPYYKNMRKETESLHYGGAAWDYNALDSCITWDAAQPMLGEARKRGLYEFYHRYVLKLMSAFMRMQLRGIMMDQEMLKQRIADLEAEVKELDTLGINPRSSKQVQELLYGQMGVAPVMSKKTKKATSDKGALLKIREQGGQAQETVDRILEVRQKSKLLGFLRTPQEPDGCMRTFYLISGTVTGRPSSLENIWYRGTNLQNIPKKLRDIFVPRPGYVMFGWDMRQSEDRIVAALAQDRYLMGLYDSGQDPHRTMAALFYNIPYDEVTPQQRNNAKAGRHGWNYGMKPNKLVELARAWGLAMTQEEAARIDAVLQSMLTGVTQWRARIRETIRTRRTLTNAYGRVRQFLGTIDDDLMREAYAYIPQGTSVDHLNFSLWDIEHEFKQRGLEARCLLQIHDGVAGECREAVVPEVEEIVTRITGRPVPLLWREKNLVIPIEFKVGKNWKEV